MLSQLSLVLGGASSGKSSYAERLAISGGGSRVYIATAQAFDAEMRDKIEDHKKMRSADNWLTIEAPLDLTPALSERQTDDVVLLDCASMWLTNHLLADHDIAAQTEALMQALSGSAARIVVVSNEVGLGIVPENALARRFRVAQGALNARLATQAKLVVGVMAAQPFALKGALPELSS